MGRKEERRDGKKRRIIIVMLPMSSFPTIETFISRLWTSGSSVSVRTLISSIGACHFDNEFVSIKGLAIHSVYCLFCISVIIELLEK